MPRNPISDTGTSWPADEKYPIAMTTQQQQQQQQQQPYTFSSLQHQAPSTTTPYIPLNQVPLPPHSITSQRQCHMHPRHDMRCHACNMPVQQTAAAAAAAAATGPPALYHPYCQCHRCMKSRGEPTIHPALGIPLGIATGGLSCAAFGIYRSVALHRKASRMRKAAAATAATATAESEEYKDEGYVTPSPISGSEVASTEPVLRNVRHDAVSELEDPAALSSVYSRSEVSEVEGSPVETVPSLSPPPPPRYSEIAGTEVVHGRDDLVKRGL